MLSLKKLSRLLFRISFLSVILAGAPLLAFAQDPAATPPQTALDAKCWTKEECNTFATDKFANAAPGEWGGPNEACAKTLLGTETGYCYAKGLPVNLNVPILGQADVSGFPEYLTLAYQFLLPAMSLIAVVMLMIGGLEYAVSGGSSKRVEKAKTRMKNAVIGLVLLFSAYAIANLLDPRLVKFGQLRLPLIKTVIVLDPNTTCERLMEYKYDISPKTGGKCGQTGKVTGVENADAAVKNSNIQVGRECAFSYCATAGTACVPGSGGDGQCISCSEVNSVSAVTGTVTETYTGLRPSAYSCSKMQELADTNDKNEQHKYMCVFESDYIDSCVAAGVSEAAQYVNCATVESRVGEVADPCAAYDDVSVLHHQAGELFYAKAISDVEINDVPIAAQICGADVCGVASAQGKSCNLSFVNSSGQTIARYVPGLSLVSYFTEALDNRCITKQ